MLSAKKQKNFTEGPIFFRILMFALPIMLTGIMQILYNMADNIVVGQFSGDPNALGAVGSTSALNGLIINLLLGTSAGTGVVVAQCYGARRDRDVSRAVHTAMVFSFFAGIAFGILGFAISRPVLTMIGTQKLLLDKAVLYMRIICIGIPASAVYNFGASILRSIGDSKTPLFILMSTGIVNVLLNLFFVIVCHMSVDGVALATITAQYLSAVAVVITLMLKRGATYQFSFKRLCFDKTLLKRILKIGIPSGIQSSLFSVANIVLTNGINSFNNPDIITAYTITSNIDSLTYIACNSYSQAAMTFTGQNYGAMKYRRIRRTLAFCLIQVTVVGIIIGQTELLFGEQLVNLYIAKDAKNKAAVTAESLKMMKLLLNTYFLCGVLEVFTGTLRGLGYSFAPMIICLTGACAFRIFWRYVFFPLEKLNYPNGLLVSFPISWVLTILMLFILFIFAWKKMKAILNTREEKKEERASVNV